jgi:hypothetical protein
MSRVRRSVGKPGLLWSQVYRRSPGTCASNGSAARRPCTIGDLFAPITALPGPPGYFVTVTLRDSPSSVTGHGSAARP